MNVMHVLNAGAQSNFYTNYSADMKMEYEISHHHTDIVLRRNNTKKFEYGSTGKKED